MLVLRNCKPDLTSRNGFKWPDSGYVSCPDWNPEPICGFGLHGWKNGEGDGALGYGGNPAAKWLVCEVNETSIVDIDDDKCKFPECIVVHCGTRESATTYMRENGARGANVIGATVVAAGAYGVAHAGYGGNATADGYGAVAVAGARGKASSKRGVAVAGAHGEAATVNGVAVTHYGNAVVTGLGHAFVCGGGGDGGGGTASGAKGATLSFVTYRPNPVNPWGFISCVVSVTVGYTPGIEHGKRYGCRGVDVYDAETYDTVYTQAF